MYKIIISVVLFIIGRIIYVLLKVNLNSQCNIRRTQPAKIAVIMGSGGHTAEMIRLLEKLNLVNYHPRLYFMASSDKSSEAKVNHLENCVYLEKSKGEYTIYRIPRSRDVHQSYVSSVFSTVHSFLFSIPILLREKPDLVICNGPGTCVPICVIAFLMRIMWICENKIVYIESICRVKTLSLSGKILLYFADDFFVQWQDLHDMYKKTKYMGCLV